MSMRPDFKKIFAPGAARYLRKGDPQWQRYFKARDDDRQLDVANLSNEELDRLKDQLDDEIVYDDSGTASAAATSISVGSPNKRISPS
jgi:hypothetical protein